jgi:hypothetical protein
MPIELLRSVGKRTLFGKRDPKGIITTTIRGIIQLNSIQFKFICVQKLNSPEANNNNNNNNNV